LVEALTGVLFMLSAYTAHTRVELLLLLLAVSVMVVIMVYDIRHFIIPDALTITLTAIAFAGLGIDAWQHKNLEHFGMAVGAALAGVLMFYFLWAISKGRWIGFGDVKLMFPLGLLVGPSFVFSLIVYAFWIGAVISLLLIGVGKLKRGKLRLHLPMHNLTIKSVVPFAPFLIVSCLLILFTHVDVLSLFTFVY
jgi:prepilin signal peptidase PulO-like enzyme (type II secretory pathway)